jgi:lipoteichoic acid synthase
MKQIIQKLTQKNQLIELLIMVMIVFTLDFIFIFKYGFNITIEHWIIAFFNVALVVSTLSFIRNAKHRYIAYVVFILIMFTFFVTDSTLYYFKQDVTSIAMLLESGKNTMKIGLKYNPLKAYNIFMWLSIASFVYIGAKGLYRVMKNQPIIKRGNMVKKTLYLMVSILGLAFSPAIIKETDKLLFNTPSDKALFVQRFGSITYHAKDIATYTANALRPLFFQDDYVTEINDSVTDQQGTQSPWFGSLAGKNLILIMCETCEEYGFTRAHTPNYYRLYDQSIVFDHFYSAAKSNYTYDAEFKALTSMMYFQADNFMYTYGENMYPNALPYVLRGAGYTANSFHDFNADFFNRDVIHPNMGFERYRGIEELIVDEGDFWTLDSLMFDQFKDLIVPIQEEPFFSFVMTVTPHGPHNEYRDELEAYYQILDQDPLYVNETLEFRTLTAAQMNFDEGLGMMLDDLEAKGLMDDTLIVIFSDHKNYSSQPITLEKTPNSDIPYEIEKVPFLIYAPGMSHEINSTLSSHYDITPTILDLFGIPYYQDFYHGESIFLENRTDRPIILSYSSWISETHKVMFDQVVSGELDEEAFLELKQKIFNTIVFYEKVFISNYFSFENPYYHLGIE